jgi:hypothetical protein
MARPSFPWRRRDIEVSDTIDGVLVLRHGRPYDPAWDLWRPSRRWPGVLVSALVTAGLLTAIAYHYDHRASATPKPVFKSSGPQAIQGAYLPPTKLDKATVLTFTGDASHFGIPFVSPGGLTTWTLQCKCYNNFNAEVRSARGTIISVPLNTTGITTAEADANYAAGQYTLDVGADGPWEIQLVAEAGLPFTKTPFQYISTGTDVFGPFPPSDTQLEAGYQANLGQIFTVQVVNSSGTVLSTPVYAQTTFLKSFTISGLGKPYYLSVTGAGLWLVGVK